MTKYTYYNLFGNIQFEEVSPPTLIPGPRPISIVYHRQRIVEFSGEEGIMVRDPATKQPILAEGWMLVREVLLEMPNKKLLLNRTVIPTTNPDDTLEIG